MYKQTAGFFNFDHERRNLQRTFVIAFVIIIVMMATGLFLLHSYFVKARYLELNDQLEQYMQESNDRLKKAIQNESKRSFAEYSYYNLSNADLREYLKFSNISSLKPNTDIPGIVGYFQMSHDGKLDYGKLALPFYPEGRGVSLEDREKRKNLAQQVYSALYNAAPIGISDEEVKKYYNTFSSIWLPNLDLIPKESSVKVSAKPIKELKFSKEIISKSKKEESYDIAAESMRLSSGVEVYPIRAYLLNSGYIVFYRTIYYLKKKYTQGFVVEQKEFFDELLSLFDKMGYGYLSLLSNDNILDLYPAPQTESLVIFKGELPQPLDQIQIIYSVTDLELSFVQKSALVGVVFVTVLFLAVLFLFFKINNKQLDLLDRQSNFVSSVSHELRTPLTAIRMHSELLNIGWSGNEESKKKSFEYILSESERLTRLIENILYYARLGKTRGQLNLEQIKVNDLSAAVFRKIEPLIKHANYIFEINSDSFQNENIMVDQDAFMQIMINLVDNAIKFSSNSDVKKINISLKKNNDRLIVGVRDYGPGVPKEASDKIFGLFVRAESELTRNTKGTGIGLAIVRVLCAKMDGEVSYENLNPGCIFKVIIPLRS